jgi:hypothetical protein
MIDLQTAKQKAAVVADAWEERLCVMVGSLFDHRDGDDRVSADHRDG